MCFRPAEVSMKVCPECGKSNKPVSRVCESCGAELDNSIKDFDADQAKLDAANTAPAVSGAPKPPAAPGAPKPPVVPGAPKPPAAQ